jgi:hypothetical protein
VLVYNLSLGYFFHSYMEKPLVKEDGILIFANPCNLIFDEIHHPSYREFFERILPRDYEEMRRFEKEFAERPEYVYRYRYCYGYHGAHPFFVWYAAGHATTYLREVIVAGANRDVAGKLGLKHTRSVEDGLKMAVDEKGKDCSIAYLRLPVVCT